MKALNNKKEELKETAQTEALVSDESNDEFLELLNKKHKSKKSIRKIIILLLCIAIILSGATYGISKAISSSKEQPVVYRELSPTYGNITIGLDESSSISLSKEAITIPVSTTIEEIYVKSGEAVNIGDPLFRYNTEEAESYLEEYKEKVDEADIALQQAQIDYQTKSLSAKQSMEKTNLQSDNAKETYDLALSQITYNLSTSQTNLDNAKTKLDNCETLTTTITDDIDTLSVYNNNMVYYESLLTIAKQNLSDSQSNLTSVEQQISSFESLISSSDTDDSTKQQAQELVDSLSYLQMTYEMNVQLYGQDVSNYQEQYDNAKTTYTDFNTDFKDTYKLSTTEEDVVDDYISAKSSYEKAQLDLKQLQLNNETSSLKAQQDYDTSVLAGNNAQTSYNLTLLSLSSAVESAQSKYDDAVETYDTLKEQLSEDGIVKSTVNGIVSSISVAEGDSINVSQSSNTQTTNSNKTVLTITSINEVYVPVTITEDDILDVSVGQEATVSLSSYPDKTFDAIVDSISIESARIGAATVTYTVNIKFTEDNTLTLYDGMSADVTIIKATAKDVLYVQKQAVTTENSKSYILIKGSDGNPEKREVTTGFTDGVNIEIKSGITQDDTILLQSAVGTSSSKTSSSNSNNMREQLAGGSFGNQDFRKE